LTPDYTTWPAIVSALEEERDAYKDAAQRNGQAADDWERAYRLARRERFTLADDLLQVQDLVRTFWRSCRGTTDPGTLAHLVERCRRLDWLEEEEPDEEGGAFASGTPRAPPLARVKYASTMLSGGHLRAARASYPVCLFNHPVTEQHAGNARAGVNLGAP
jgi:hypothetical protein